MILFMEWILIIIVWGGFLFGVYKLALHKNRSPGGWILASVIIQPLIIIIILALMPKLNKRSSGDDNFKTKKKKKKKKR